MESTIDKAGRVVVPKTLRDEIGLVPGPVEISVHGTEVRIRPIGSHDLVERDGLLFLPDGGPSVTDEEIREMRLGDQR